LSKKGMAKGGMVNSRFSPISKPQRFLGVFWLCGELEYTGRRCLF